VVVSGVAEGFQLPDDRDVLRKLCVAELNEANRRP